MAKTKLPKDVKALKALIKECDKKLNGFDKERDALYKRHDKEMDEIYNRHDREQADLDAKIEEVDDLSYQAQDELEKILDAGNK